MLDEERLIAVARRISSVSQKLMEEEEEEDEKLRFLLLDLQFYRNYFFSLANHGWWGISLRKLHPLGDNVLENEDMRIDLYYSVLYSNEREGVSYLEEKLLRWKKQLLQNYPILLKAKCLGYISPDSMAQFITSVSSITFHLLRCRDDLADDEKQAIRILHGRLRFFMVVVQLVEIRMQEYIHDYTCTEEMNLRIPSLFECIQHYTCKAELFIYSIWTGGQTQGDYHPLMQKGSINSDKPCSIVIILDVFNMTKDRLLGEGLVLKPEEDYLDEADAKILIWEYTIEWIHQIVDDDFSKELLDWISSLIVQWESETRLLHQCLTFLASFVSDLSFDMKIVVIRAATYLGLLYSLSFEDLSEEIIKNVNLQLSVLVTSLNAIKAEVSLIKLLSSGSSLIIFMMPQLKELLVFLKVMRECFTYMITLMSRSKALVFETLSFLELLVQHEMEEDTCTDINLAFLKLLGTKLIQVHVLALGILNCDKNVESEMEDELLKLCEKLGSLVGLLENLDVNNVNNILFLLDTGAVAIKVASLIYFFSIETTAERVQENTPLVGLSENLDVNNVNNILFLLDTGAVPIKVASLIYFFSIEAAAGRVQENTPLKLSVDIGLLEAELILNSLLNQENAVDVIVPFGDIELLRSGFRLVRTILMDSTPASEDNELILARCVEWVNEATPLVSLLFDNKSNVDMTMEMNDSVSLLLERVNDLEAVVKAVYLQIRRSSQSAHPRTDRLGFIDCLVDNLSNLSSSMPSISWMKYQIWRASKDLKSSRSLLNDVLWDHSEDDELNNLVSQLTQAAYEVEYVAEAFLLGDSMTWKERLWISNLIDEIEQISLEITGILANRPYNNNLLMTSRRVLPVDAPSTNEVVVGMKEQEDKAINQLTRGSTKLGIVSIVGMGGLGKTTLANKVFNAPLVRNSFDVLAWCCISKVYQKREILLDLIGYIIEVTPEIRKMTDDDMSNRLRQLLLGRTYLIVMDDVWDTGAWKELQHSFPKDEKRSRIMLTSRTNDIASKTGYGFEPCSLGLLSDRESWELLERKLFEGASCPLQLREVGWEISLNCKGLPLAVVVISGILAAKEMNVDWWKQVAGNINSVVVGKSKIFTNIIDLSYRYLPDYLKPCFLYLGAFQEDDKIRISNLIHLWIAEGFIKRNNDKNLNDAAMDYLMELVSRNLLSVAERTSRGGIKACRIHDLLHELCRDKAEAENFLHVVKDRVCNASVNYEYHRVCIHSTRENFIDSRQSGQFVRSLLFFATRVTIPRWEYDASFISLNFKLLRTLKLDSINIGDSLLDGIVLLVYLRFLAIQGTMKSIPDSIERLSNLEIFSVKGLRGEISLPHSIWSLKRLMHLHVKDRFVFYSIERTLNELSLLENLESLSSVFLPNYVSTGHILQRLSRLKRLKCIFSESWNQTKNCNEFPVLNALVQLESLKVLYHGRVRHPSVFSYPATLKKLTLSKFRLPWKEISAIGNLPCLEVLKLLFKAFEGEEWNVGSEEFQNLKYLKLDSLDIVRWTASCDSFPCLEQIVLQSCKQLEEVPFAFGESPTLQTIQVNWCIKTVVQSARDIQGEQFETLARKLNVLVHPPDY